MHHVHVIEVVSLNKQKTKKYDSHSLQHNDQIGAISMREDFLQ